MGIKISELSSANEYNNNDVLLVSRLETSQSEYITFNYKIDNFRRAISGDVQQSLYNTLTGITATIKTLYDGRHNDLVKDVEDHIKDCETEHAELCDYLETLSCNLCTDLTDFKRSVCLSIDAISSAIDSKFNEISQIISTENNLHAVEVNSLIREIRNYISTNYVTLTSEQTITGQKRFTKDIIGTAMSARWA